MPVRSLCTCVDYKTTSYCQGEYMYTIFLHQFLKVCFCVCCKGKVQISWLQLHPITYPCNWFALCLGNHVYLSPLCGIFLASIGTVVVGMSCSSDMSDGKEALPNNSHKLMNMYQLAWSWAYEQLSVWLFRRLLIGVSQLLFYTYMPSSNKRMCMHTSQISDYFVNHLFSCDLRAERPRYLVTLLLQARVLFCANIM